MFLQSLKDSFSSALEERFHQMLSFKTSADVVMKASGLRQEAIKAIAHEQGIEIEDTDSRCIDENLLSLLAEAHIRQLKFYFNNSKRHISELSGAELSAFITFTETFKKHQLKNVDSWNDIDTDAIWDQFNRKVHQLTPSQNPLDLFAGSVYFEEQFSPRCCEITLADRESQSIERQQDDAINNVLKSRWLYTRPNICHSYNQDARPDIKRVTLSARYYVFPDDDHLIAC